MLRGWWWVKRTCVSPFLLFRTNKANNNIFYYSVVFMTPLLLQSKIKQMLIVLYVMRWLQGKVHAQRSLRSGTYFSHQVLWNFSCQPSVHTSATFGNTRLRLPPPPYFVMLREDPGISDWQSVVQWVTDAESRESHRKKKEEKWILLKSPSTCLR